MSLLNSMLPRHPRAAGRTVSVLCAVAAAVSVVFAPFQPEEHSAGASAMLVGGGMIVVVLGLAVAARLIAEANRIAWTAGPLLAVAAIVVVDLLTRDATVSAQIFFVFPVLYGASQLPVAGSVVMTAASLLGEIVVVSTQLPFDDALVDAGYVSAALVTLAVLLTSSNERQARLVARLERLAAVDPLTGLVTRRVLDEAVTSALSGAASGDGTSLIVLDVDEFKAINDRHGHPVGDAVLIGLADLILEHTRPQDVVCRLGGDEIALLLPGCPTHLAKRRAEELLAAVRGHEFRIDGQHAPLRVSISLGIAHAPTDAVDLVTLYSAADGALYEAKRTGRGRVAVSGGPASDGPG